MLVLKLILLPLSHILAYTVNVDIVSLGNIYPNVPGALSFTGPGIETGAEEVNRRYSNVIKFSHSYLYDRQIPNCVELATQSDHLIGKWYYGRQTVANMTVFLYGGCLENYPTNRLAGSWNILMITSAGNGLILRNKTLSPTWITTSCVSLTNYLNFYANILRFYSWSSVFIVLDLTANPFYLDLLPSLVDIISSQVPDSQVTVTRINTTKQVDYKAVLKEFFKISRVLLFLGHGGPLRDLLLCAGRQNMTDGEFVYIAMEIFPNIMFGKFTWDYGDEKDQEAEQAFRSLLLVGPDDEIFAAPSNELVQEWKQRSLLIHNVSYNQLNPYVMASYSSVMILGQVLSETVVNEPLFDLSNGKSFATRFFNRTFNLGFTSIYMDEVGERRTKLVIRDLNVTTGKFEPALFQDAERSMVHVLKEIDWGSDHFRGPPQNRPICGYEDRSHSCLERGHFSVGLLGGIVCAAAIILVGAGVYVLRYYFKLALLEQCWWTINLEELYFSDRTFTERLSRMHDNYQTGVIQDDIYPSQCKGAKAELHGSFVWAEHVPTSKLLINTFSASRFMENKELIASFNKFRETAHINLCKFVGTCTVSASNSVYLISEFCGRGSLHNIFRTMSLDWDLQFSLISDLIEGMNYIHFSVYGFHGSLTGYKCLVDQHFTLKISDLGYNRLRGILSGGNMPNETLDTEVAFWTAPELLRGDCEANPTTDIFSLGIIIYQIFFAVEPYQALLKSQSPNDIIREICRKGTSVSQPALRPEPPPNCMSDDNLDMLIRTCWHESAVSRPTISVVRETFMDSLDVEAIRRTKTPLVERVILRLSSHAEHLEREVHNRTVSLIDERKKCDELLKEMLPRQIVNMLRNGLHVDAELFDSVTVMFSGLCGFEEFVDMIIMSPLAATKLLDRIYSFLDPVLTQFDVYKIEAIRETYMIASGIPIPSSINHAKEICSMSFAFYKAFERATDNWLINVSLKSGIHTGPCAAGVVGHHRPRYCLFGDSVNIASRMAVYSEPAKIHISPTTAKIIIQFPEFVIASRGFLDIKGKGEMETFWLNNLQ